MMTIKERIDRFNTKHPIPTNESHFGPRASVPMYGNAHKARNGKMSYSPRLKYVGDWDCGYGKDWSSVAIPPKQIYGMMTDVDEFVNLVRMYEIMVEIPDLRGTPDATSAFYNTSLYWKKADFEIYIEISTNKIYDKNGNPVRKSDKIFPCVTAKISDSYSNKKICSMRRKLTSFKEMKQIYFSNISRIRGAITDAGYEWNRYVSSFEEMIEYFLSNPSKTFDTRTETEKRDAFCRSWITANIYNGTRETSIYKLPEQYNGKNVYQIVNSDLWRVPVAYLIGKDYCIFSARNGRGDKLRIGDVSFGKLKTEDLSVFDDDPNIGWVSKMKGGENKIPVEVLLKSISNIFYEQLTKMNLPHFLRAHMMVHGGPRRTGNVLKYYGITKRQAEVINEYFGKHSYLSRDIVMNVFGAIDGFFSFSENISNEKDFETIFAYMIKINWSWSHICNVFDTRHYTNITKVERDIIMDQKKKLLKMVSENNNSLIFDMIDMYMSNLYYETTGSINWSGIYGEPRAIAKSFWLDVATTIHSYADAVRKHDFYMEKRRENEEEVERKRDEEKQKFFASLEEGNKERQKKWEFSNEKFSVVFPMKISDVKKEGETLHHCVGGYAERHLKNETTILFLRKNEEIDVPFYTIEVCLQYRSRYSVAQIHGAYNKWVGNDPDAAVFLYRYFKSHDVECDKRILLRTSSGYCGSDKDKLDESILTDED